MTLFTLPTSFGISQSWNMDFNVLNGKHYPNGFYASIGWLGHNGIDYRCPSGTPVEAVCDGVIEYVGPGNNHPLLSGGGNTLLLRNDELGIRFEYLHLSQQNVYTGQRVKRGQVIALSGNTGISSGAHLHLGAIPVRPNLNNGYRGRVDPTPWLYGPSNPDYAGLAAAGTITPQQAPQEDELSAAAEAKIDRLFQIAEAQENDRIRERIIAIDERTANTGPAKFFRGWGEDKTIYENENGTLRALSYDEWAIEHAKGETFRDIDPLMIDKLKGK